MRSNCDCDFGKYSWNLYSEQSNERALKRIHSIHRRYLVHHFWLVHGRFIYTHIQQVSIQCAICGNSKLARNTHTATREAALSGVFLYLFFFFASMETRYYLKIIVIRTDRFSSPFNKWMSKPISQKKSRPPMKSSWSIR